MLTVTFSLKHLNFLKTAWSLLKIVFLSKYPQQIKIFFKWLEIICSHLETFLFLYDEKEQSVSSEYHTTFEKYEMFNEK